MGAAAVSAWVPADRGGQPDRRGLAEGRDLCRADDKPASVRFPLAQRLRQLPEDLNLNLNLGALCIKCFCLPSLACAEFGFDSVVRGNRRDDIAPSRLVASLPKRFFDKDEYKHHSSAADMAKIWARERRKREHVADKLTSVAFGVRSDFPCCGLGLVGSVSSPFVCGCSVVQKCVAVTMEFVFFFLKPC